MDQFKDPIHFSLTGFEYKTKLKSLIVNKNHSLGIVNRRKNRMNVGLVQAFAEIDMQQVKFISGDILTKKRIFSKDLAQIEPWTILTNFKKETFFSLFYEQDIVYEIVYD